MGTDAGLEDAVGASAGCLGLILRLAFYAACALVVIALTVWAWHYLFD
jgi:hypothetical protein